MPTSTKPRADARPPDDAVVDATATVVDETSKEVVPVENPGEVFKIMDRADEELVAAEIAGDAIELMAYEFTVSGKKVRGLSYEGVNECVRTVNARQIGTIECPPHPAPQFTQTLDEEGNEVWECMVYAIDRRNGGGCWGIASASRFPKRQDGTRYADPMSKRKALSKAQRNAKKALVPMAIQVELLKVLTGAQIKRIQTPRQLAQDNAKAKQQQRQQQVKADAPKRGTTATAAQQRKVHAKAGEAGINERMLSAIVGWIAGTIHVDRLPKDKVDPVLEALQDAEAVLSEISDKAREGDQRAKWVVDNVLAEDGGGEQQQMSTEAA